MLILRGVVALLVWLPTTPVLAAWDHWGGPPSGLAFVTLESQQVAPLIQIVGTTRPPTLNVNGKRIELRPLIEPSQRRGPEGVWINGRELEETGKSGRFFTNLTPDEAASPSAQVLLRGPEGTLLAELAFGGIFLDAPISVRRVMEEEALERQETFEFVVQGAISQDSKLSVEGAQVSYPSPGVAKVEYRLSPGDHVSVVRLETSAGTTRILNQQLSVKITRHDPQAPLLSWELPDEMLSQGLWDIPPGETELRGLTVPHARIKWEGQDFTANASGEFRAVVYGQLSTRKISAAWARPDRPDAPTLFRKEARCSRCGRGDEKKYAMYAFANLTVPYVAFGDNQLNSTPAWSAPATTSSPALPGLGLGARVSLARWLELQGRLEWYPFPLSRTDDQGKSITASSISDLSLGAAWVPWRFLALGVNTKFRTAYISNRGFSSGVNSGTVLYFHPQIELSGRLAFWKYFEFAPRVASDCYLVSLVSASPIQLWTIFTLDLSIRAFF